MRQVLFALGVVLAALASVSANAADAPAVLTGDGVVMADDGGAVTLTVDLSRPVGWRLKLADGPPRVVVELAETELSDTFTLKSTSVLALETVKTGSELIELQAILREPLSILSAEMTVGDEEGAQLTVRLQTTTADVFQTELETDEAVDATPMRPVIAIDPGHGGRDPGAEAGGIREADLVLAFGLRLRDVLVASGKFDVVMTRTDDSFLSLDERLSIARVGGAEVFLSLHADALADADAASGIVLYRLPPGAHASANLRLQERHEPDDQLTGLDLSSASEDVTLSLLDLARQRTMPRTRSLSAGLLTALEGAELTVNNRPERTQNFAVLKAADIPSLLIELGFLSTEADLDRLTSEDWQTIAAEAIRDGLTLWSDEDRL
ncbi:MAG: N-acetylmuramoyl-L-alanine amidase family protein [Paracoccaceae bacterium]